METARLLSPLHWPRLSVRSHLIGLVLVALLPLLLFAAVLIWRLHERERGALERGLRETTRALATAVDAELNSEVSTLEAIAASRRLDVADLRGIRSLSSGYQQHCPSRWTPRNWRPSS